MPKVDIASLKVHDGTGYPSVFHDVVRGRERKRLGDAGGLTQFGVNLTTLRPGAASALRHWHHEEDEMVFILDGELVLVEDEGETMLRAGDAATFKAGVSNGHHLVNRTDRDAVMLEIGTRAATDRAEYPDVDLLMVKGESGQRFTRRSGDTYE